MQLLTKYRGRKTQGSQSACVMFKLSRLNKTNRHFLLFTVVRGNKKIKKTFLKPLSRTSFECCFDEENAHLNFFFNLYFDNAVKLSSGSYSALFHCMFG